LVTCLLLLAFCGLLASCGDDEEAPTKTTIKEGPIIMGFSQIGAESDWRTANTRSIKAEAKKRGVDLRFADAQGKQENQIEALRTFITQKVDIIAFSPKVETGWTPVLTEIKEAGIPVIITDRAVDSDPSLYVAFIGSDFVEEGRRAARWLAENTEGKLRIAELQGTVGASCAIDRKKGFEEVLKDHPRMEIVLSQDGDFSRAKGKEVMEAFLKSPKGQDINCLFAHNDDMALGAIQAIKAAGKKPGVDVTIISIDGVRAAFDAMIAGELNCTVECNPLIGPKVFDLVEALIKKRITIVEGVFDQKVAKDVIETRKY